MRHNSRRLLLFGIVTSLFAFSTCSDESPASPTGNPNPNPNPTPDPDPVEIPAIAPTNCDFELDEAELISDGWEKVFEENFDADLAKWNIWTGGAFNNELQHYQSANLELSNGALLIHAKKESVTGANNPYDQTQKNFEFTSGRIESKSNFSASSGTPKVRMIARIKLPAGYGLWPAFWSYGDPWPTQGEIDILEARGNELTKYHTNYFYGTASGQNLVTNAEGHITADDELNGCYHVYEMIWSKNSLTSILDGTIVEVKTSGGYIPQMFGKQQRITLNLAVGGLFFSNLDPSKIENGTLEVDWVKVFTSN
jgi:beta-glucanase (GH16 family)